MKREFSFGKKFFLVTFSLLVFAALLAYVTAVGFRVNDNMFFVSPTDGKVGIGTAAPTEKLDVVGKVKATQFCLGTSCITTWPTGGGSGGSSQWTTSGSNIYYNAGKVGIGTNNPPYLLSLNGTNAVLSIDRKGNEPAISFLGNGDPLVQIRGGGAGLRITDGGAQDEWAEITSLGIKISGNARAADSACSESNWGTITKCTVGSIQTTCTCAFSTNSEGWKWKRLT